MMMDCNNISVRIKHEIYFFYHFPDTDSIMLDFSSKSLGVWAGIGTAAFLGYCIYFDK